VAMDISSARTPGERRMKSPVFVILSFEGPDRYSHIGGLGTRVSELSAALADDGFETHLFFVGNPSLPGHQTVNGGDLHLHRWCQWISAYYPEGVYAGEDAKLEDWTRSLPPWLEHELLAPQVAAGRYFAEHGARIAAMI
jgi:hypothetical protein